MDCRRHDRYHLGCVWIPQLQIGDVRLLFWSAPFDYFFKKTSTTTNLSSSRKQQKEGQVTTLFFDVLAFYMQGDVSRQGKGEFSEIVFPTSSLNWQSSEFYLLSLLDLTVKRKSKCHMNAQLIFSIRYFKSTHIPQCQVELCYR